LGRLSRIAAAAALTAVAALSVPAAKAQDAREDSPAETIRPPSFDPADSFRASEVDPVTLAVLTDALLRLQFLAVAALEAEEDVGLAQSGVVRAYLARRQKDEAVEVAERIDDTVWKARSFIWISDYTGIVEDDAEGARAWLERAIATVQAVEGPRDEGETLRLAALRLAERGFPVLATQTAREIPGRLARVRALQQVSATALAMRDAADTRADAAAALRAAFEEAQALALGTEAPVDILFEIGSAQLRAQDPAGAATSFALARTIILEGAEEGRDRALTRLAAKMVEAGNQRGGMQVVRLIPEGAERARALGAVAAALGQRNVDAAVPLFRLAMEQVERIDDQALRFDVITDLVHQQTRVGRLRDAFEAAALITEEVPQAAALLGMGRVLIDQGKLSEALILKDFIPFVGMRAQLMAPVAYGRGVEDDPQGASALLSEALDPTGFPFLADYAPDALDAVLTAQIRAGVESADQAIFSRARDLAETLPSPQAQVRALSQLAIAEARRGRIADAQKTISNAYRLAFEHRDGPGFDDSLMAISLAQLAAGDLLGAYDTAARIPEPPSGGPYPRTPEGGFDVPRYQALMRVAAAAGRLGDPLFGQEVTGKIAHDPAKAVGLAAVAIAMANQTSDLISVINDIRSGELLSPDYEYLSRPEDAARPRDPGLPDLGEAPSLAPLPAQ
jgi:tetratricopeptide (TPR) repeat protein